MITGLAPSCPPADRPDRGATSVRAGDQGKTREGCLMAWGSPEGVAGVRARGGWCRLARWLTCSCPTAFRGRCKHTAASAWLWKPCHRQIMQRSCCKMRVYNPSLAAVSSDDKGGGHLRDLLTRSHQRWAPHKRWRGRELRARSFDMARCSSLQLHADAWPVPRRLWGA